MPDTLAPPTDTAAAATSDVAAEGSFIDSIDSFFSDIPAADSPAEPKDLASTPTPEPKTAEPKDKTPEPKEAEPKDTKPADPLDEVLSDLDDVTDDKLKDWTPEAAYRFKELKTELKAVKARAAELEAKSAQFEEKTKELEAVAGDARVKELETLVAEYEGKLLMTRLEETSSFKKLVREPIAKLVGKAETLAEKYSLNPDDLVDAILLTDEATQEERFAELLASASDRDKFSVYQIVEELKPVITKRDELYAKHGEALAEAEALDKAQEQAAIVERLEKRREAAKAVASTLDKKIPFLRSLEGLDFDGVIASAAEADPSSLDPVEATYRGIAGKVFPKVAAEYLKAREEINRLTEMLAEYSDLEPRTGGGTAVRRQSPADATTSFVEAVDAAFGR